MKRARSLQTLLVALLFAAGAPALATPVTCEELLRANAAHVHAVEQGILDGVTVATVDYASARKLAPEVILLPLRDGNQIVLRLASDTAHPTFESFASRFIQNAPGGASPSIKVLGAAETLSLLKPVPHLYSAIAPLKGATLAVYFSRPIELGRFYLEDHVGVALREHFTELAQTKNSGVGRSLLTQYEARLRERWKEATDMARESIAADLRTIIPELRGVSNEKVVDAFIEHSAQATPIRLEMFQEAAWKQLPADLQAQLADHWALYTILGIPDFHFGNWLVHNGKVLAIDAALRSPEFTHGKASLELDGQHSPLDGGKLSSAMRRRLAGSVSDAMIKHLSTMSNAELTRLAYEAGYAVKPQEVKGMRGRIHLLRNARY